MVTNAEEYRCWNVWLDFDCTHGYIIELKWVEVAYVLLLLIPNIGSIFYDYLLIGANSKNIS